MTALILNQRDALPRPLSRVPMMLMKTSQHHLGYSQDIEIKPFVNDMAALARNEGHLLDNWSSYALFKLEVSERTSMMPLSSKLAE